MMADATKAGSRSGSCAEAFLSLAFSGIASSQAGLYARREDETNRRIANESGSRPPDGERSCRAKAYRCPETGSHIHDGTVSWRA